MASDVGVSLVVPATAPVPTVPVTTGAPPAGRTGLPITGVELIALLLLAALLLAVGGLLLQAGRRRRRPT